MVTYRLLACLIGLLASPGASLAADDPKPQRIVSLNLCTDELLMRLVEPERIASITYLSRDPGQTPPELAETAARIPENHGLAEEVIMMEADLVVAGTFSARPAVALLRKLGYRVIDFQPETDFDDMRANIRLMGEVTGETARAEDMVAELDARLARLPGLPSPISDAPVYADVDANLFVQGEGTLAAAITNAAGYRTLGQTLGYSGSRQVSLEQIVLSDPDLISLGGRTEDPPAMATQVTRHPALRRLAASAPRVEIPDRLWVCGSPTAVQAAETLAGRHGANAGEQP